MAQFPLSIDQMPRRVFSVHAIAGLVTACFGPIDELLGLRSCEVIFECVRRF
jgi:hypothetical protein